MLQALVSNSIIVVLLAGALTYLKAIIINKKYLSLIMGLMFGICTVFVMQNKNAGIVDFRHVIMTLAGFSGGYITVGISVIIPGVYRLIHGGTGANGGVISIFLFGLVGVYLSKYKEQMREWNCFYLLGCGFTLGVISLVIIPLVPPWNSGSVNVMKNVALPLLLLTPISTLLSFKLFFIVSSRFIYADFLESILGSSSQCFLLIGSSGKLYLKSNNIGQELESVVWKRVGEFKKALKNEHCYKTEIELLDGQERVFSLQVSRGAFSDEELIIIVMADITKERQMAKQVARMEALSLIGQMAASVSHEVRNPLTTVRGMLQLLAGKEPSAATKDRYNLMIDEVDRANSIISEYLSLARDKSTKKMWSNLNEIIVSILPLLQASANNNGIMLRAEFDTNIPPIKLEPKGIKQVIINLVKNAIEATKAGGSVYIRSSLVDEKVVLSVQDTGSGIPPEILANLGTPFCTSKENGTGLGLSVCYDIADYHDAIMDVDTNDNGTVFRIKFKCPHNFREIYTQ